MAFPSAVLVYSAIRTFGISSKGGGGAETRKQVHLPSSLNRPKNRKTRLDEAFKSKAVVVL